MSDTESVIDAFGPHRKGRKPAVLLDGVQLVAAARQHLMRISLVADVPDDAVIGRIEHVMQGDGELHRPQARGEVATARAHGLNQKIAQLPHALTCAGRAAAGIYALEKDRLMLCLAPVVPGKDPGRRPAEFKTRDGDGLALFVLERVGPKGPVDPGPRDQAMAGFERRARWQSAGRRIAIGGSEYCAYSVTCAWLA